MPESEASYAGASSAFISNTKRLGDWDSSGVTPGPGYYDSDSPKKVNKPKKKPPRTGSLYHSPTLKIERKSSPGPGEYIPIETHLPLVHPSPIKPPHSPNKSKLQTTYRTSGLAKSPPVENLGPGSYHKETSFLKQTFRHNRADDWTV